MNKIRIAYVINNLTVGGAEKLLLNTIQVLDQSQFEIHVIPLLSPLTLLDQFVTTGAMVHPINMKNKRDCTCLFKLIHYFKKNKIEIVHTHLTEADFWGRLSAILAGIPIILATEHSIEPWKIKPETWKAKLRILSEKLLVKHSCGILAVSEAVRTSLIEQIHFPKSKVHIQYNGILFPDELPQEIQYRDHIAIGFLGRLCQPKRIDRLFLAFSLAQKQLPTLQLKLAGSGPLLTNLQIQADALNLNQHITFLGHIDNINNFFQSIDILIFTSDREGIPLAMLEAMYFSKPIISTTVGGIPEVIRSGTEGILTKTMEPESIANAIVKLSQSSTLRINMGKSARERVINHFNLSTRVKELECFYKSLITDNQT
ncbi:glycosyltransferase [bacterium]|nr:glycosyltransferase [bacterium]